MVIACLGWGSLIWRPGQLPIQDGWKADGPSLPVEYARVSNDGRLTLVLHEAANPVPTLWASLNVTSLDDARTALQVREGTANRWIGRWPTSDGWVCLDVIVEWAKAKGLDGVVWTALPPKFGGRDHVAPSEQEAIQYLSNLSQSQKVLAEEYVRKTPSQVRTNLRTAIEDALGWTPS